MLPLYTPFLNQFLCYNFVDNFYLERIIMKRINNIKIYEDLDNNALIKHICKKYHILYEDILDWHIIKKYTYI